jgi:hypothetical protein
MIDKERLKELNKECFLLLTGLTEMQTKIEEIRKEIMEANNHIVEELDK